MSELLNIKVKKYTLENGLEVILYPDNSLPVTAVNIWYKTGSANEVKGKTGLAHLFEHMMFQGSVNVPKEKHFKYIQEAGGTLNGSTSNDRTNYFETVPSNFLEMALWLESDRMGFLLPALDQAKLDNQKDVVMNERRQRYDNQPYGRSWELLFSNLFPPEHPYHWPVIGWMEDIEKFELEDAVNFFRTHYSPSNASLVIGGNINIDKTKLLVEKYFSEIPSFGNPDKPVVPESPLKENKRIIHPDNIIVPKLFLGWQSDKLFACYDAPLDIAADILAGSKSSILQRVLVHEKQVATDIAAFQYSGKYAGIFFIIATPGTGYSPDDLKEEILSLIGEVGKGNVNERDIVRSKNSIYSSYIYSLQHLSSLTDQINNYNCNRGEPESFIYDTQRYQQIVKEEVIEAVSRYLTKPHVELQIVRGEEN